VKSCVHCNQQKGSCTGVHDVRLCREFDSGHHLYNAIQKSNVVDNTNDN